MMEEFDKYSTAYIGSSVGTGKSYFYHIYDECYNLYPSSDKDAEVYSENADSESEISILHKPKHGKVPLMKKNKEAKPSPLLLKLVAKVKV